MSGVDLGVCGRSPGLSVLRKPVPRVMLRERRFREGDACDVIVEVGYQSEEETLL